MRRLFIMVFLLMGMMGRAQAAPSAAVMAYIQGVQCYKTQSYQQAAEFFTQSLADNPNLVGALMGRANCYYYLGFLQKSLADFERVEALKPSAQVAQFIQYLQAKLKAGGQTVMSVQPSVTPQNRSASEYALTQASSSNWGSLSPSSASGFGVRAYSSYVALHLADFQTGINTAQAAASLYQQTDPSTTFSGTYPISGVNAVLEPFYRVDPHFSIGLPISSFYAGAVSIVEYSASEGPNDEIFTISALSAGLDARYVWDMGDWTFELSGGPEVVPVYLQYTGVTSSGTVSGGFSAIGFGGQAQLGAGWKLTKDLVIGPLVGYQVVTANGFHGTAVGALSSTTGTWTMIPTSQGMAISLVPDGTTAPAGSRLLVVDLTGFTGGLQLSFSF